MIKKVTMKKKSSKKNTAIDKFVHDDSSSVDIEPTKRITVEITEKLHRHIKSQCAVKGLKMSEKVKSLLLKEFGDGS